MKTKSKTTKPSSRKKPKPAKISALRSKANKSRERTKKTAERAAKLERTVHETEKRTHEVEAALKNIHRHVDEMHGAAHGEDGKKKSRSAAKTQADKKPFPIIAIGASAGGLEAMTELFKKLPANPGMAFVVMQHLDPTHESALPSLLGRVTGMAVTEAKNNMPIVGNCVYVIPPNKAMRIASRRLKIAPRKTEREVHMPIDHFLESLAEEEADNAIGVILSGNGSDGTRGLQAVKAAGGVTFAQDEKSAKYTAMPANAIAAGCVDFVLSPPQIAVELVSVAGRPIGDPLPVLPSTSKARGEERAFEETLVLLRQRTGVDFAHYKRPTLDRRIRRRLALRKFEMLREYADYLRAHPAEVQELFGDILIHITEFFRDPAVFNTLKKKVFPRLVKARKPDEPIRLWIPGCSSGEEVYSIAIALVEFLSEKKLHYPVQIFGTDINLAALDRARQGFYPAGIADDVAAERLRRFFTKSDSGYRINKSIREMCVFARQNVVVDPPFSNLDLVSCRNVLIYLGALLQRKVFPVFHYALKPTGFLLLGASETTGSFFRPVHAHGQEMQNLREETDHLAPRRDVRARAARAEAGAPAAGNARPVAASRSVPRRNPETGRPPRADAFQPARRGHQPPVGGAAISRAHGTVSRTRPRRGEFEPAENGARRAGARFAHGGQQGGEKERARARGKRPRETQRTIRLRPHRGRVVHRPAVTGTVFPHRLRARA